MGSKGAVTYCEQEICLEIVNEERTNRVEGGAVESYNVVSVNKGLHSSSFHCFSEVQFEVFRTIDLPLPKKQIFDCRPGNIVAISIGDVP